jgi:hypothetical protein
MLCEAEYATAIEGTGGTLSNADIDRILYGKP